MAPIGSEASAGRGSIADVTKSFGTGSQRVVALEGVTLDVSRGEFVCLLGASGCGKSTLLNLVAGLDQPTSGRVEVRAERTGLMFQEAALFPWLTVRGNVEIALKLAGMPRNERRPRAEELLEMVHLGDFAKRRPHELSGGMRQRALRARAARRRRALDGRAVRRTRRDDATGCTTSSRRCGPPPARRSSS